LTKQAFFWGDPVKLLYSGGETNFETLDDEAGFSLFTGFSIVGSLELLGVKDSQASVSSMLHM